VRARPIAGRALVFVALSITSPSLRLPRRDSPPKAAQSSDIRLTASVNKERKQIDVSLRNNGRGTYLMALGALFPSSRVQALHFVLLRNGRQPEPIDLSFDEPGVVSGNGGSWVAVFTPGAEFDFTFPLQSLRLFHSLRTSVADLHGRYTLKIEFPGLDPNGEMDIAFVRNWRQNQLNAAIPFWQGKLTAQVAN
jgi:hypothetical protein